MTTEYEQSHVEYEIHFNRGYGWQGLNEAIQHSSPVSSPDQAWEMVERMRHVAKVDAYYEGAEVRVVRVTRQVIPPDQQGGAT